MPTSQENLSAADRLIEMVTSYVDHAYHGRPGIVTPSPTSKVGVTWSPVTTRVVGNETKVFTLHKLGKKTVETEVGVLNTNTNQVRNGRNVVGEFRKPGLFKEVVVWMYLFSPVNSYRKSF
jgi:hypothetical protein